MRERDGNVVAAALLLGGDVGEGVCVLDGGGKEGGKGGRVDKDGGTFEIHIVICLVPRLSLRRARTMPL